MPKYANYAELAAAFKSGELDEHYYLMLDNGGTENCLNYWDKNASDEENERKQEECSSLFDPGDDPKAMFEAMGIRCKWC